MDAGFRAVILFIIIIFLVLFIVFIVMTLFFNNEERLEFENKINSSLSADKLWGELEKAFKNSTQSSFWPNELESVKSEGLAKDSQVNVTYKLLSLKKTFTYTISNYKNKSFTYIPAQGHPLKGEVNVEVTGKDNGSVLQWHGYYLVKKFSATNLYLKYFIKRFFEKLQENLKGADKKTSVLLSFPSVPK